MLFKVGVRFQEAAHETCDDPYIFSGWKVGFFVAQKRRCRGWGK